MRYYIITFLLFISSLLFSQNPNIQFSSLSINDGLSQSAVYTILQDSEGFVWFGTTEGINKYNGNEFVHFKYELTDSNSLSDNFVVSLIESSDKNIWVATRDGGVNIFNKISENFEQIKNNNNLINYSTNIIFEDSRNNIWIGTTKGIGKYDTKSKTFNLEINNLLPKYSLNTLSITAFYEDYANNIWIGTRTGELFKIVDQSGEIIRILPQKDNIKNLNRIGSILIDKENENLLWLISEKGLFKLDILTEKIEKINLGLQENITFHRGIIDNLNNIWIGSQNAGLFKFNPTNNSIINFKHKPSIANSISNNNILSFYIDNSNLLWIGTRGGGVNKLLYDNFYHLYHDNDSNQTDLINNNIWAIYEDSLGILWIGTENGLGKFDKSNNKIVHYQNNQIKPKSINSNFVFAFCEDQFNNLWIGTAKGLNLLNRETNEFEYFVNQADNTKSLNNNLVKSIYNDSYGNLWIGTRGGGLDKFNYIDKTFTHYTNDLDDSTSISSNLINTIFETSDGILWIGTGGNGLDKFNREDKTFTHYTINLEDSNSINDIYVLSLIEGPDNNLWIGTFNGGLNKFNYRKEEFTHFTTANGLASNIIYSIEMDDNNNFWLSSNGVLSKFSITDHSVINYSTENGLENMEFNLNSSFKNKDGILYFGGINGIDYFNPEMFDPEIKHTSLHFTKLVLNNEITNDGKNMPINKSITFESQITLEYNEYPFSIYFSLLDFQYTSSNNYKYKINQLSKSWIDIGNENKITFPKLPHGKYTLEVQASNSFNILSETKSIDIIIIPPFWKKIWFVSMELLLLLILIFSYIFYREKRIKQNNKLLELKVTERTEEIETQKDALESQIKNNLIQQEQIKKQNIELEFHKNNLVGLVERRTADLEKTKNKAVESDRLKSSFLANISHEIRTPMNAIVGFSELLLETGNPTSKQLNMLNLIQFNSNSLLNLINDIVDIAKLEQGDISLNKVNIDINKLLKDIYETYNNNKELKQKKLELKLIKFNEPIILNTDEARVKQIFSKLLDNAIKYTEKGVIEFGYKIDKEKKSIQFYVKDSGIGLSDTQKDEIFKLFRKIETHKNKLYRGVGLGLTFCHKLVQILLGEIWVKSKVDIGSTFYFTIPINTISQIKPKHKKLIPDYNWKNKNILIAEDEINNYKFLEAALKLTQANIFHAENGEEVVRLTNFNKNIDLILMDIKMPVMDGLEATKVIRKTNKKIKIIAFTAYAMTNDEALAIDYGCDDYISKPAKPQHIMKIINEHLN